MRLGKLCDVRSGGTPKRSVPEYWNEGSIPWVKISDISNKYVSSTEEQITEEGLRGSSAKILAPGTLLYSIFASIGAVGILEIPAATNQAIAGLSIKTDRVIRDYLYHFLKSQEALAKSSGRGAAQNNINLTILRGMEVPLPSIDDQKEIVDQLEGIAVQIEQATAQIDQLDSLVKSRFVEMFGDPTNNEFDFPVEKLGGLGLLERGKSKHRPRNAPELRGGPNGPYPLIQTGDIANAGTYLATYEDTYTELGLLQSRIWPKGTLCITIAANIAKTSILAIDACFPDSVVGFTTNGKVTNLFMHYWFSFFQSILEKQAPQAAQKNINLRILQNLDVIAPPLALQREFADFVAQVDKSRFVRDHEINFR